MLEKAEKARQVNHSQYSNYPKTESLKAEFIWISDFLCSEFEW